jgi:hypothetical protein
MNRRGVRREAAIQRAELTANLTPEQKIARIDQRFGKDVGAKKERAKLSKLIEARTAPKKEEVVEPEVGTEVVEKPKKKAKQRRTEDKNLRHKTKE